MTTPTLYITATPIGNLEDITLRALRILKEVDVVFAEDTRVARKLLSHHDISTTVDRYDEHSHDRQVEKVIEHLREDRSVAYISDAGTPGISDPGARLVQEVRGSDVECRIVSVPGPSSLTAALSVSGVDANVFEFLGFVPHKKGRQTFFRGISNSEKTIAFYESVHRITKTLASLNKVLEGDRRIVVCRELTKIHEEVVSGSPREVKEYFDIHEDKIRGEFVVVVE